MIRSRNRARGGAALATITSELSFVSGIPSGFTYTRADTVATYRNASGQWVIGSLNVSRQHLFDDGLVETLMEVSRVNKCTTRNISPVDLTGITASGNVSAVISIVDDTTALTAAGLNLGNGMVIEVDNTLGGSGTASANIAGVNGNTNPHSLSAFARALAGTNAFILDSGGSGASNATSSSTYTRLKSEGYTPTSSSRTLRLSAPIGCKARFTLYQMEEGLMCTTPIIVAGATATRAQERIFCTNLALLAG